MVLRAVLTVIVILSTLVLGCAETPNNLSSNVGTQLNITMTVAGEINPAYFYYVVFNNANDQVGSNGPEPVIAPPWGNGFVAGAATQYMEYGASQSSDGYFVYAFVPGSLAQTPVGLGAPTQDTPVGTGGSSLQFRIPLSMLATTAVPTADIKYIQVNFIATDTVPVDSNNPVTKTFDALGDTTSLSQLNDYITIPVQQSITYNNSNHFIEPTGDVVQTNGSGGIAPVNNPDLDITDWSVQVTQ